jgi:hypothetical protein
MKITNVLCDPGLLTGPLAAATKNKVGKSGKFLAFEKHALNNHVYAIKSPQIHHNLPSKNTG